MSIARISRLLLLALSVGGVSVAGLTAPVWARPRAAEAEAATSDYLFAGGLVYLNTGNDSTLGNAGLYDVRCSPRPITETNFEFARRALVFRPLVSGSAESCKVSGLSPGVDYYFAVKTCDAAGNWSPISNLAVYHGRVISPEGATAIPVFFRPWPNPARSGVHFHLSLPTTGNVLIQAFDAAGRRVRSIASQVLPAGVSDLSWDLHSDDGRPVKAGVYFLLANLAGSVHMKQISVLQ